MDLPFGYFNASALLWLLVVAIVVAAQHSTAATFISLYCLL